MAAIDDLLKHVTDPVLRDALVSEVELLRKQKDYGLVFERHLPETVILSNAPVRRGDTVTLRNPAKAKEQGNPLWHVVQVAEGTATLKPFKSNETEGERETSKDNSDICSTCTMPIGELIVMHEYGKPIYPGLEQTDVLAEGRADSPCHAVINGENLHALEMLLWTHEEKIDVIYIDPPYNTGNDGFTYNDKRIDINDANRHSKWLSFMERRLILARRLLKETGLVFISIDDNEQAGLKLLMDSIFGASNFIGQSPRKTRSYATTKGDAELQTLGEYLIIYSKNKPFTKLKKRITGRKEYPYEDARGKFYTVPLNDNGPHGYASMRPNLYYPIYVERESFFR